MKHLTVTLLVASTLTSFAGLASGAAARYDNLSLEQALRIALENHHSVRVSQASIDIAEAQYRQAMAAFGPKANLEAGVQRADEDRTFTFSGTVMTPAMDLSSLFGAPPGSVGLPSQPLPLDLKVPTVRPRCRHPRRAQPDLSALYRRQEGGRHRPGPKRGGHRPRGTTQDRTGGGTRRPQVLQRRPVRPADGTTGQRHPGTLPGPGRPHRPALPECLAEGEEDRLPAQQDHHGDHPLDASGSALRQQSDPVCPGQRHGLAGQ
jgi:hypothetical protein